MNIPAESAERELFESSCYSDAYVVSQIVEQPSKSSAASRGLEDTYVSLQDEDRNETYTDIQVDKVKKANTYQIVRKHNDLQAPPPPRRSKQAIQEKPKGIKGYSDRGITDKKKKCRRVALVIGGIVVLQVFTVLMAVLLPTVLLTTRGNDRGQCGCNGPPNNSPSLFESCTTRVESFCTLVPQSNETPSTRVSCLTANVTINENNSTVMNSQCIQVMGSMSDDVTVTMGTLVTTLEVSETTNIMRCRCSLEPSVNGSSVMCGLQVTRCV